jgi:hypothetical protein
VIALEKIFYKNLQESARTPKKRKKRQKTRFLRVFGGQAETQKKGLFWALLALFTLLNRPKNPTFRKMHEKQGVTGGSKKTSFFVFFCVFFAKKEKKYFIDH